MCWQRSCQILSGCCARNFGHSQGTVSWGLGVLWASVCVPWLCLHCCLWKVSETQQPQHGRDGDETEAKQRRLERGEDMVVPICATLATGVFCFGARVEMHFISLFTDSNWPQINLFDDCLVTLCFILETIACSKANAVRPLQVFWLDTSHIFTSL